MSVEIENLTKRFGLIPVVDQLHAHMRSNAISVLLGPSGCGKTTTLRCIAGLEEPTIGSINIHGTVVFSDQKRINLPPERRDLGMVFQSYAIWPHMTVYENVALPIRAHGGTAKAVRQRADRGTRSQCDAALRWPTATGRNRPLSRHAAAADAAG